MSKCFSNKHISHFKIFLWNNGLNECKSSHSGFVYILHAIATFFMQMLLHIMYMPFSVCVWVHDCPVIIIIMIKGISPTWCVISQLNIVQLESRVLLQAYTSLSVSPSLISWSKLLCSFGWRSFAFICVSVCLQARRCLCVCVCVCTLEEPLPDWELWQGCHFIHCHPPLVIAHKQQQTTHI